MSIRTAVSLLAVVAALIAPASASAATDTFHRFEVVATANYVVMKDCGDGRSVRQQVIVLGGHEEEQENGESTLDSDFLTVFIRGFDCDGSFISDSGSGPAEFTWSPSLQTAAVTGTITTRQNRTVTADVTWEATGPMEVTSNTTTFPGFTGHFVGQEREAVATGTVVVDGNTLVNGSTTSARIETLEDKNISYGSGG
jgi:hypothetical protein